MAPNSNKLTPDESCYSAFGRELLAVYSSIRSLRHFLEGVELFILTDRKPLTYALRSVRSDGGTHTARELRQLAYISEFTTDIRQVKGSDNVIADALSRSAINVVSDPEGVNFDALAAAQREDEELRSLQTTKAALKLQWMQILGSDDQIC